jgi:YidC/Oxa1 family membrane protein insertase
VTVAKKFVFFSDRFDFDFSLQALRGNQPIDARLVLGPNFGDQSVTHAGSYITGPQAIADVDGAVQRIAANAISTTEFKGTIDWAGVEDNYFALILIPHNHTGQMDLRGTAQKVMVDGVLQDRHFIASVVPIEQGQTHTIFAGPKDPEILSQIGARIGHPSFEFVINYGIGGTLVKVLVNHFLLPVLNFTYRLIPNYGVAILLITFAINMAFFPLKWKSTIKMKKAQAMQPKMKELQDKMKGLKKDDPKMQELQTEQLRMMREANPFGGCLPMLVQLPFFWAFFVLLTVSIDVRQAPFFGWIDNLTAPDTLHLLGFDLHVLPIAMCLSWVAQTFIMPMPGSTDPSQAAQQKIQKIMMGVVMPVIFTVFFFWQAPSGLVLYWMFNSLVGVGQQLVINRLMPAAPPDDINKEPQPKKGKSSAKSVATTR